MTVDIVGLSRGVYESLLRLYPASQREAFGEDMVCLFEEISQEAVEARGLPGLAALWLQTMGDVGKSAVVEHIAAYKERKAPRLDRYELKRQFESGCAHVYQAYDPQHRRQVVLKVAAKRIEEWALVAHCLERSAFLQEHLQCPNLPRFYEAVIASDRAYLVYELVRGQDLQVLLNQRQTFFPARMVVEWGIQLCDTLAYLHGSQQHPIVVRDIKPANLLLEGHGRIRLIDLGFLAETPGGWAEVEKVGTEGFAAKEQYEGLAGTASDLFGVGATMHYLLTNLDPRQYEPFTFAERPIRAANPTVSAALEQVVMTAVANDPEARFASSEAMRLALQQALAELP